MAAKKVKWAGVTQTNATTTAGDYSVADNWVPNSIRNGDFSWTVSGSGTGEYYLRTAANGDPGLVEPSNVQYLTTSLVRSNLTAGTAGSLATGSWDYADNDALGYSTIYVRLPDGVDPDGKAMDYVTYTDIPKATDHVRIPATSTQAINAGTSQRTVAIGDFIVEAGYNQAIGSANFPLYIDPDLFEFAGGAEAHIDIHSANISPTVHTTFSPQLGKHGLYLTGSNIATLNVISGNVGVAVIHNQTSVVSAVRPIGEQAKVTLGAGVTLTTFRQVSGDCVLRCAVTTVLLYGGKLKTEEIGDITTVTQEGGEFIGNSVGTITTYNGNGGRADFLQSAAARTITTLKRNAGFSIRFDPGVLTITNKSNPDYPVLESHTRIA